MDEQALIQQLRSGEDKAFELIFRKYFPGLCLFAEHFVRNQLTAEEIVEDFFCHLWDNCTNLTINSSLRGYLYRSIHNRCLNYIRDQQVRGQHITESQYYFIDKELLEPLSPDQPASELIMHELDEKITNAINALPDQCRRIFCMNRFENLIYTEIAAKLGISVNTVKTQMTRALQKLRNELQEYLIIIIAFLYLLY